MAKFELGYTEIDGFLYPNIEIDGEDKLKDLGKYGLLRLNYLHLNKEKSQTSVWPSKMSTR